MGLDLQTFRPGVALPTLMVVSHERSGTHFLINSLARAFGYLSSDQRADFDQGQVHINYCSRRDLSFFFSQLTGNHVANVLKSHHEAAFLAPVIDDVLRGVRLLYIYRHPRDVMHSFWRLLKNIEWREGPSCDTPADLMRAQPEGQLMRYQMQQRESMLHRWMAHVSGWIDLAEGHDGIHLVRYEDLRDGYPEVMTRIGESVIGVPPANLTPPDKNHHVVVSQARDNSVVSWDDKDLRHIESVTAPLLKRLGYA